MKKLEEFMNIMEYRTKKNPAPNETVGKNGDVISELDPKTDNSVMDQTGLEEEDMSANEAAIQQRFDFEKPFFILGHAGWAKTSIVKRVAKRNGYRVLIVYLDKACKEDLGGMPIVVDDKKYKGTKTTQMVPPEWAKEIIYNQDKKYLLFFDEMNQADPEVMNALMPIVQDGYIPGANPDDPDDEKRNRCTNFLVGAAGNYKDENTATHELNGPLLSRFKPLIIWEDNNDAAWEDTFKFYHKKYDSILGKDFIDAFWEYRPIFDNPRELNEKLWDPFINVKKKGLASSKRYSPESIAKYIYGGRGQKAEDRLIKKEIAPKEAERFANELGEIIYEWLTDAKAKEAEEAEKAKAEGKNSRRTSKAELSLPEDVKEMLYSGIVNGFIDGRTQGVENVLYAVAEDNVYTLFDPEVINAESIKHYIKHLAAKGLGFKYKTVKEALADTRFKGEAKIVDPNA